MSTGWTRLWSLTSSIGLAMDEPHTGLGRLWDQIAGRFETDWTKDEFQKFVWRQRICRFLKHPEDVDEYAQLIALSMLELANSGAKRATQDIKRSIWRVAAQLRRSFRQATKHTHSDVQWENLPAASPKEHGYDERRLTLESIRQLSEMEPRDLLVLEAMIRGTPSEVVAKQLGMSNEALRKLRSRLLEKLRCLVNQRRNDSTGHRLAHQKAQVDLDRGKPDALGTGS